MKTKLLIGGALLAATGWLQATPLTESTFTDIVRSVEVLSQPAKNASPAALNEVFKAPDLVRTGVSSRAELTAPDQTITRVGANTVFSFAPASREIDLEQGSVLFHSPSGRGGGMIKSGGASAAVSGTTLIVVTSPTDHNGFKVILLEGHGRVTLANGKHRKLKAGQMVFILPNHNDFGPILTINLAKLVAGSALVNGFSHQLPSLSLIQLAIQQQQSLLANGGALDTGTPADNFLKNPPPQDGPFFNPPGGDPNLIQIGVNFPGSRNLSSVKSVSPGGPTLPAFGFSNSNLTFDPPYGPFGGGFSDSNNGNTGGDVVVVIDRLNAPVSVVTPISANLGGAVLVSARSVSHGPSIFPPLPPPVLLATPPGVFEISTPPVPVIPGSVVYNQFFTIRTIAHEFNAKTPSARVVD